MRQIGQGLDTHHEEGSVLCGVELGGVVVLVGRLVKNSLLALLITGNSGNNPGKADSKGHEDLGCQVVAADNDRRHPAVDKVARHFSSVK